MGDEHEQNMKDEAYNLMQRFAAMAPQARLDMFNTTGLYSTLAANPWFNDPAQRFLIVNINNEEPTPHREVVGLYDRLDTLIGQAAEEAKAAKRPLVILLGEDHFNRNSLAIELMTLHIAKRHGIHLIGDEIDTTRHARQTNNFFRNLKTADDPAAHVANWPAAAPAGLALEQYGAELIYGRALETGTQAPDFALMANSAFLPLSPDFTDFEMLPIDLAWEKAQELHPNDLAAMDQYRNGVMAEILAAAGQGIIAIVGYTHLQDLGTALEGANVNVLSLDISQRLHVPNIATMQTNPYNYEAKAFNVNDESVTMVVWPGAGGYLALHASEMIEAAINERHPRPGPFAEALAAEREITSLRR